MPPKERKSITPWVLCQGCGCTISNKDVLRHSESSCPPPLDNIIHCFIKDKSLFSFIEEQKPDSKTLKNVPAVEHSNIVQMSQQAMQLCDIGIGEPVIVKFLGEQVIRTAWPTPEGSLMSVFINKAGLNLLECQSGTQVHVCNLSSPPLPAKEVVVSMENSSDSLEPEKAVVLLQDQQQGRVFFIGSRITLRYLGLTLKFRVVKATSSNKPDKIGTLEQLSDSMKNLDIGVNEEDQSFIVGTSTNFQLDSMMEGEKQTEHKETLENIGGLDDIITELQEIMLIALSEVSIVPGLRPSRGVLLYGVAGVGKSMLAKALGQASNCPFFSVRSTELFSKFYGETESRLKEIFKDATRRCPSVIFLDDIDVLCQRRSGGASGGSGSQLEQRVVAAVLAELDALKNYPVMVIATTNRPEAMDEALRRPGRLDREIELPVPGSQARRHILKCMLADIPHQLTEEQLEEISRTTHGFVGADLQALCSQAMSRAIREARDSLSLPELSYENFKWARAQVKPSAMREATVEIPSVRWSDIGGQHDLKQKLRQAIEWPLKHPEAFTRLGIRPPRGVLMYGPPGCSKTMIARALATESGLNFLSIKGPELFSKWVGESERAVRAVFQRARQVAPAIVFFDELDALCGERAGSGAGGSSVQERVLAQLLTELDGVEPLGNVTIVAATNRPDRIDKALLRPGRLDRIVHVPLPDKATRHEIFTLHFRKTPIADGIDISGLVDKTEGYSGAEVTAVCHEAALAALQEDITASRVELRHFEMALKAVTPRTSTSLLELYAQYQQ